MARTIIPFEEYLSPWPLDTMLYKETGKTHFGILGNFHLNKCSDNGFRVFK